MTARKPELLVNVYGMTSPSHSAAKAQPFRRRRPLAGKVSPKSTVQGTLKLCPNKTGATCKVDEGTYSRYAGPLKYENSNGRYVQCTMVTALMWDANGRVLINRVMSATVCD